MSINIKRLIIGNINDIGKSIPRSRTLQFKMSFKFYIFILLLFIIFFISCTNPEKKFKEAETANTIESFQIFLIEFPESKFSILAKNKIDSKIK